MLEEINKKKDELRELLKQQILELEREQQEIETAAKKRTNELKLEMQDYNKLLKQYQRGEKNATNIK